MKISTNIQDLENLASSQWGLFTTAQAAVLGVGRTQIARLASTGRIECMRRGTYRYTIGEETAHASVKAAWLSAYPKLTAAERLGTRPFDAVVAGATAASLHGIGDFHENPYTFIVIKRRQTNADDLSFHAWVLDNNDVTFVDTLPVTTMERTIADLVRERQDPNHIERTTRDALSKGASARKIESLLNTLRTRTSAPIDYLMPIIDEGKGRQEEIDDILAEIRRLDGYFRSLIASPSSAPHAEPYDIIARRTDNLEHFVSRASKVPPEIVNAVRSLNASIHALADTLDTERQAKYPRVSTNERGAIANEVQDIKGIRTSS